MLFCPTCGNILLIEDRNKSLRYFCRTCPYIFNVNETIERIITFEDKEDVDLIYNEKKELEKAPTAEIDCPNCHFNKATYKEIQTRSADEPTTIYYKCKKCGHEWAAR